MWSQAQPQEGQGKLPSERCWHTGFATSDKMFVIGGCYPSEKQLIVFDDLHSFDSGTGVWTEEEQKGDKPPPCWASSSIYYQGDNKASGFLFGGRDKLKSFNVLREFSIATNTWTKIPSNGTPPSPRCGAGMSIFRDRIIIFGGDSDGVFCNDIFFYSLKAQRWTTKRTSGDVPTPRGSHSQQVIGNNLFIYGGTDGKNPLNDMYSLDLVSWVWKSIKTKDSNNPGPRYGGAMVAIGSDLLFFGGSKNDDPEEKLALCSTSGTWFSVLTSGVGPPSNLIGFVCGVFKGIVLSFGGQSGKQFPRFLFVLDTSKGNVIKEEEMSLASPRLKPLHKTGLWTEKYTIIEKIGRGGFSIIRKVQNKGTGGVFAAKKVDLQKASADLKKRIKMEVNIHRSINHPNIVPYVEAWVVPDSMVVVVMDLCKTDLHQVIQQYIKEDKFIEESTILTWLKQLMMAVNYLHQNSIIHQDLKSANVFFTEDWRVQLGDFGLASKPLTNEEAASLKRKREIHGTPQYMSPQMLNFQSANQKTDVWSIGVILYEMTALRLPFDGNSITEITQKATKQNPNPLPDHFSSTLQQLIALLLCKKESLRLTAQEILNLPLLS